MPWGGLGLHSNVAYIQSLIAMGVDVMIAGESDNYGMRFCTEIGIDLIETSHETSEMPGLVRLGELIAADFKGLDVRIHQQDCIWQVM
jgi:putative NIF3 family GTP cyclohydrolase 1 type 2